MGFLHTQRIAWCGPHVKGQGATCLDIFHGHERIPRGGGRLGPLGPLNEMGLVGKAIGQQCEGLAGALRPNCGP